MQTHAKTLFAPLAAAAVVGLVGLAPAQATGGGEHGHYGQHDQHRGHGGGHDHAAAIVTSEEATAVLDEADVDLDAVDPASASTLEDGRTKVTFPKAEESPWGHGEKSDKKGGGDEIGFDGGVTYASDAASTTWLEPSVDTEDWTVSFEVDGQRVDLLQVVPEEDPAEEKGSSYGKDSRDDVDLALTDEGATALNAVAGDGAFAEGDVLADLDDGKAGKHGGHDS